MFKYIISLILLTVFIAITIINILPGNGVSLNLIFFKTTEISAIVWIYIGILLGTFITIPVMYYQLQRSKVKIIDQYVKKEAKRIKLMKKAPKTTTKDKDKQVLDTNINPTNNK